jgi:hypothetical protein
MLTIEEEEEEGKEDLLQDDVELRGTKSLMMIAGSLSQAVCM